MSVDGGVVGEYGSDDGGGWDPALLGDRMAWVRKRGGRTQIVAVRASGDTLELLIDDFTDFDDDGGFVHLASTDAHFVVAMPSRSWLRAGVDLRRYSGEGRLLERIDFVAGRFNGLDASEHGIALVVERGASLILMAWDPSGREHSLKVPRVPGPLVEPHVAAGAVYLPVGNEVHRLALG